MKKKRAESREGHVVTTVSLPPELHREIAIAALEDNMAIAEVLRQAAIEWLGRRGKRKGKVRS